MRSRLRIASRYLHQRPVRYRVVAFGRLDAAKGPCKTPRGRWPSTFRTGSRVRYFARLSLGPCATEGLLSPLLRADRPRVSLPSFHCEGFDFDLCFLIAIVGKYDWTMSIRRYSCLLEFFVKSSYVVEGRFPTGGSSRLLRCVFSGASSEH